MTRSKSSAGLLAVLVLVALCGRAGAAEITVFCPRAVETAATDLASAFRKASGHEVKFIFGTAGALRAKVTAGEAGDVIIGTSSGIDRLASRGTVVTSSAAALGRVGVGVAVRSGAPMPDISTPEKLRQAILAARSLGYANPAQGGTGGTHFARVLERLGIAEAVKAKTVLFPEGAMALRAVAAGEIEMAVTPVSEIVTTKGLTLVGPLPAPHQNKLAYAVGLLARAPSLEAAKAFISFLTGPIGRARFIAAGFEAPE